MHLGWKLGLPDLLLSVSSKATTESEDKFLRVNSLCDKQLTEHLQAQLNTDRSKQVSVLTVKRRLQAAGLTGQVAVRKPLLRWQTKKKRLAWAMKHRQWSTEDRKAHGQMQFDIFCSTGRVFVHHWVGERMVLLCVWHQLWNIEEEVWWSRTLLLDPESMTCTVGGTVNQN